MTTSLVTQRVLHQTTDISVAVGDFRSGVYAMTYVSGQYVYIGTSCPMNNISIDMTVVSAVTPNAPVIEVWWGAAWVAVVDLIDQTSAMTVSGRLSWALDLFKGWDYEQLSTTVGLSGTAIYNRYWMRLSWPNNFTATLGFIGQKFSDDVSMASLYPDLMQSNILTGFKAGKTTWNDQHFMAAEAIIKDLRRRNIILKRGQVMDWTVFEDAACHKVAEIVYQAFGAPYKEHVIAAKQRYETEMNTRVFVVDITLDGHLDEKEKINTSGWMVR